MQIQVVRNPSADETGVVATRKHDRTEGRHLMYINGNAWLSIDETARVVDVFDRIRELEVELNDRVPEGQVKSLSLIHWARNGDGESSLNLCLAIAWAGEGENAFLVY